ncbi:MULTISPECIES: type II toxin-antitoxin system PemK/MazF family toxin [unclassified Aureimonas]|uniref:type II toxin-antitoxin system PemK/MazF family toxin n=1 Tax=unclassified Aureimonas TaxID=2615206 RepID=UPI0006FCB44F|nr:MULTISPECIES: type II toxin-antitoxin system PemK/MazF family toxin [unclassified Aureimonas]KQT66255.1 hypothetical protein ASG62_19705 [Aureimonas sp. Leaf427]KQT72444.1 hypothetical protein ASG54_04075 [Aureimonas sp. Leaf460]
MERGSIVIVSAQGDYGKPRPAVVIQNGRMADLVGSVTVCFMTSDLIPDGPMRVTVPPDPGNGLQLVSQIQIEKIMTFPRAKVRGPIGLLMEQQLAAVERGLLFFLDLIRPIDISIVTALPRRTD